MVDIVVEGCAASRQFARLLLLAFQVLNPALNLSPPGRIGHQLSHSSLTYTNRYLGIKDDELRAVVQRLNLWASHAGIVLFDTLYISSMLQKV